VLIILVVGIALGTVRALARSLGASLLVHVSYNSTIAILLYIGTDGYKHLEKLNQ
jgi:membrane protease YdiL (CAAX protease family)